MTLLYLPLVNTNTRVLDKYSNQTISITSGVKKFDFSSLIIIKLDSNI